jgi:phosphopantothenoylcysteine decarboxylase/phosphopantothenate--cysteine ligase
MGIALAAAAARRGAEVTLIAANVALSEPAGVRRIDVETAEQLARAAAEEFKRTHVLLMAAAPADFRAATVSDGKLARQDGLELRLEPTEDILAALAATKGETQTVVGFAAEHGGDAIGRARGKLGRKNADLIVLNDVSNPAIGFESADNAVTLIDREREAEVPIAAKEEIAAAILARVDELRAEAARPAG